MTSTAFEFAILSNKRHVSEAEIGTECLSLCFPIDCVSAYPCLAMTSQPNLGASLVVTQKYDNCTTDLIDAISQANVRTFAATCEINIYCLIMDSVQLDE